jgi:putative ATP-dependent endonuclease of OLD family
MRLTQVRIENFRSFADATIHLDDYTCLVGPNGTGKSVVLMALNVLFQETASTPTDVRVLSAEDFHHKKTRSPVKITATFEDLPEAAQHEFREYYRQGKLVIFAKATWDEATRSAPVIHYGSRLVMKEFAPFFEAEKGGKKVDELRDVYSRIRSKFSELAGASTKPAMTSALRGYEESHPERCELIEESNQFYGFTKGGYHLENYVQWVYVPAVKDASTEQDEGTRTALGQLLARTVRTRLDFGDVIEKLKSEVEEKYTRILEQQKDALKELELSMARRLQDYVNEHARLALNWHYDAKTSIAIRDPMARADIGDADFIGEVARAGHGMQRAFLLTILHELVGNEKTDGPKLLLGFEEPELYQHPPQAQHLADVLERLSGKRSNAQIIVTTHSPYFITAKGFENVRMFSKCPKRHCSRVNSASYAEVEERLKKAFGEAPKSPTSLMAIVGQTMHPSQRELFFTPIAVLVEGLEDIAFISSHLRLSNQWNTFRTIGCHFIVAGGKDNIARFAAIAQAIGVVTIVIFDSDNVTLSEKIESTADDPEKNKGAKASFEQNAKINSCLLDLCGLADCDPGGQSTFWGDSVVMWADNIGAAVHADFGEDVWHAAENRARELNGFQDGVKQKNAMLIAATMEQLCNEQKQSASLAKLCAKILQHARTTHS